MKTQEAKAFVAINPKQGSWGRGKTLAEAVKNCKANGAPTRKKQTLTIVAFSCEYQDAIVFAGVNLSWSHPDEAISMQFTVTL